MNMPDGDNTNQSKQDRILSRLVRAARKTEARGFTRPDDDTIIAYLMGTATPDQDRLMRAALCCSEAFRREILQMAKGMEDLEAETAADTEPSAVPRAPSRQEFLRRYGDVPEGERRPLSFLTRLRRMWGVRVYVPAAVVAALVVLFTMRTTLFGPGGPQDPGVATPLLVQSLIAPEELIGTGAVRGHRTEFEKTYASSDEAAKAVFRGLLERSGTEFVFVPVEDRPRREPPKEPAKELVLWLVDDTGRRMAEFKADVPVGGARPQYGAYMLTLPSTALYKTDLVADTTRLVWPDTLGTKGCIAFTYACEDGYCGAGGGTFQIH